MVGGDAAGGSDRGASTGGATGAGSGSTRLAGVRNGRSSSAGSGGAGGASGAAWRWIGGSLIRDAAGGSGGRWAAGGSGVSLGQSIPAGVDAGASGSRVRLVGVTSSIFDRRWITFWPGVAGRGVAGVVDVLRP